MEKHLESKLIYILGNFLSDVYEALSHRDCAITLTTNHRSEGRLIVENAIRIGNQCLPHFDERQNFSMMSLKDKEHLELGEQRVKVFCVTPSIVLL